MNNEELKQLDLLALFHYIFGGITAIFSSIPFIHVFMGFAIVSGNFFKGNNGSEPPPFLGWMFVILGISFIVFGWSMAICIILAGKKLKKRKNRIFCMVVAGIECMFTPFGTILGVFTLMTLSRDSVKQIFAEQTDK